MQKHCSKRESIESIHDHGYFVLFLDVPNLCEYKEKREYSKMCILLAIIRRLHLCTVVHDTGSKRYKEGCI